MAPHKRPRAEFIVTRAGVACSKGASSSIGRPIPKAVIAAIRAVGRRSVGGVGKRVRLGGPARSGGVAAGSSRGGIGVGFPCRSSSKCRWSSRLHRPSRSLWNLRWSRRARASAQRQFLRIIPLVRALAPAVTRCSRSPRRGRHGVSVRASAVGRYATCWIAKRVTAAVAVRGFGRRPGRRDRVRRDVVGGCAKSFACEDRSYPPAAKGGRIR